MEGFANSPSARPEANTKLQQPMKKSKLISRCFLIFAILGLISCSTNKHVNKTKETTNSVTETASTSTVTSEADTNAVTKQKELTTEAPLTDLLAGDTSCTESGEIEVQLHYDPVKKKMIAKVTAKPQIVPFKFKKVEEKHEKKVEEKTVTIVTKEKEVKRWAIPWWIWVILILIMLICVAWRLYKKKPGS